MAVQSQRGRIIEPLRRAVSSAHIGVAVREEAQELRCGPPSQNAGSPKRSGGMLQRSTPAEHSGGALRCMGAANPRPRAETQMDSTSCRQLARMRRSAPLDGSAGWFHWMVPLHGPATWARCMGPLHGSAAWVRCMGPLPPHSVACKPLRSNGHTLRAVSAAIAPVQPLPLTVWRVSHCVVMVTPCALCFGCSLKLKRTPLVATASVLCSVRHKPTSGEACELVSLSPSLGLPHRHQALRGPRGDQVV